MSSDRPPPPIRLDVSLRQRLQNAGFFFDPADPRALHDKLLFLVAYPANPREASAAESALRTIQQRFRVGHPASGYDNSGCSGTLVRTTFSIDLIRWLSLRNPRTHSIDWENEDAAAAVDRVLPLIACPAEIDGILSDQRTTREWVSHAARKHAGDAAWLIGQIDRIAVPAKWLDDWFESLSLPVCWRLAADSRTTTRFPKRPIFCTAPDSLLKKADLSTLLEAPLPKPAALGLRARSGLIDTARAVLAARARETDPVTYANPRDVALFRLDRGVDVALFGMTPDRRLPIESYVGFVAARNRVPIAYGGSWIFARRCAIGVNLFEEFRGGESAQIFGQVMRTYRQWFDVSQFLVDPFQFGADNEEAIKSGAFWFYYRLGFRPIDETLRRQAEREAARLRSDPAARTSHRLLRRFATGKIFLDVPASLQPTARYQPAAPNLERIGIAVSDWIASRFVADRSAAEIHTAKWIARAFAKACQPALVRQKPLDHAVAALSPLFAMLHDRQPITRRQWAHVATIVNSKAGNSERQYVRAWQAAMPDFREQFAGL